MSRLSTQVGAQFLSHEQKRCTLELLALVVFDHTITILVRLTKNQPLEVKRVTT